ncbi:MAG TPA: hydrolase, partial [Bacilli bacterium]
YNNTMHYSNIVNADVQVHFTGTGITLFSQKDPDKGIAAVSIDGGSETLVDLYSSTQQGNVQVWTSGSLSPTTHILKVRVTGTKNASSGNTYLTIDRVTVQP